MGPFSDKGILLKRTGYGDFDLVISLLTESRGKIPLIAKNAKKSRKRFMGLLEPFSVINVVCRIPKRGRIPVLVEASADRLYENIRSDVIRSAYAAYWAEITGAFLEEWKPQKELFYELVHAMDILNDTLSSPHEASIGFQIRFLELTGLSPHLLHCSVCDTGIDHIPGPAAFFDLEKGGVVCDKCLHSRRPRGLAISKGTAKTLAWIRERPRENTCRPRFSALTIKEALGLLELFLPYYLGREPRSLPVLNQLRKVFNEV